MIAAAAAALASADVVYRVTMGDCFADTAVLTLAQPCDSYTKHIFTLQNSFVDMRSTQ
jgi:hypothetical protein